MGKWLRFFSHSFLLVCGIKYNNIYTKLVWTIFITIVWQHLYEQPHIICKLCNIVVHIICIPMTLTIILYSMRFTATSVTRLRAHDHYTSSTLIGGDGSRSKFAWGTNGMQDGCRVYMDSHMASNASCFMVTWTTFKTHLGGRPNTKPKNHGTPNARNRWFILLFHVWGPTWMGIHWNKIWLRARSRITLECPWPHYMILEVC